MSYENNAISLLLSGNAIVITKTNIMITKINIMITKINMALIHLIVGFDWELARMNHIWQKPKNGTSSDKWKILRPLL